MEVNKCVRLYGQGDIRIVGERVSIDPLRPCMDCRFCQRKRYNICVERITAGIPNTDGGQTRYMIAPAKTCSKLPEQLSLEAGACIEPLSIGVHALHRASLTEGDVVIVIGAGTIGLLAMQAAKARGASKVLIADVNPRRLELAKQLGADVAYKSGDLTNFKTAADDLKQALGDEADLVIECSGATGSVDTAIHACRLGGKVLMIGFGEMAMNIHAGMAAARERETSSGLSATTRGSFPECLDIVASSKVNVTPVITHILPLDKVKDALDLVRKGETSIKVMLDCQK